VLGPPTSAPRVLEQFLAAEAVCVYYHPTQPQLSVLAPGTDVALVEMLRGGGDWEVRADFITRIGHR
jgi:hypothetical protein